MRVYGGEAPGPGFEPAEPDLQDVYFSALAGHVGAGRIGRRSGGDGERPGQAPAP